MQMAQVIGFCGSLLFKYCSEVVVVAEEVEVVELDYLSRLDFDQVHCCRRILPLNL